MRVGLIARADDRGLGHMTWEFARALQPDRVMVVDLGKASTFPNHLDRYDNPLVMGWDADSKLFRTSGTFDAPEAAMAWLDGLDVVYSAETFYDWRLVDWARARGVATVLHVMPELTPPKLPEDPTQVWAPTTWRLENLPPETIVVPVPVAMDRFPVFFPSSEDEKREPPLRLLHVAGRRAAADRNGTNTLFRALRLVERPVRVTITTQDDRLPAQRFPAHVAVRSIVGSDAPADYWDLYGGYDALVMPRKYGGLCLPVQEAAAAGLAIVMPDVSPNNEFPARLVGAFPGGSIETPAGHVPMVDADPRALAAAIDALADRAVRTDARQTAYDWARRRSWGVLAPTYQELLVGAVRAFWGEGGHARSAG